MSAKKPLVFKILIFAFLCLVPAAARAEAVSSDELISRAKDYDGKAVLYEGEVIGDVMVRGDYAWINVNDGISALGIWLPKALAQSIRYTGSYKSKGDRVRVRGVFRRACPEHGGDLDIHADTLNQIRYGEVVKERVDVVKVNNALALAGVLCLTLILMQLRRRQARK